MPALLVDGGGLCSACGRLSYKDDQMSFCAGCRRPTAYCSCFDPIFGLARSGITPRSPTRVVPRPRRSQLERLTVRSRAKTLSYLSRLIDGSPVCNRLAGF